MLLRCMTIVMMAGLGLAGCGSDLGECPSGSETQQAAGKALVEAQCVRCHSSKLTGSARQDAPADLNFDVEATVKDDADDMYSETESGSMPPDAKLTSDEIESIRIYLACYTQ